MGDWGNNKNQINQKKMAGYEYLLAYKIIVPIYDLTVEFTKKYIPYNSRTRDQMEQAARSGMQNIPEGYKQQSLAGYIKLSGISRGSLEELLNDYLSFSRQNKLEVWDKERAKAVNLLVTLIQQANFLIDKLIESLKEKHTKEGGFNENLLKKRLEYRNRKQ